MRQARAYYPTKLTPRRGAAMLWDMVGKVIRPAPPLTRYAAAMAAGDLREALRIANAHRDLFDWRNAAVPEDWTAEQEAQARQFGLTG